MKFVTPVALCAVLLSALSAAGRAPVQIKKTANTVVLTWAAQPGNLYTVQSAPTPAGPWGPQTNLVAGSNSLAWTDVPIGSASQRFYRLLETPGLPLTNALVSVGELPFQLISPLYDIADTCASAVFLAQATNGTLTQTPANTYTYSPTPSDRLVVQLTNGLSAAYYVSVILGSDFSSATAYLENSHDFEFREVSPGLIDMNFTSIVNGGSFSSSAQGTVAFSNILCTVALSAGGQHYFSTDSSGTDLQDDFTITGTITAPGYSLSVNQRRYFEAAAYDHIATTAQDHINSALTIGTDVYQWVNVYERKDFTDGHPVHYDPNGSPSYWTATGAVTKNGAAYGTYNYYAVNIIPGHLDQLQFRLLTPTDTIVLENWTNSY